MATIKISIIGKESSFNISNKDAKTLIELCFRLEALDDLEINESEDE